MGRKQANEPWFSTKFLVHIMPKSLVILHSLTYTEFNQIMDNSEEFCSFLLFQCIIEGFSVKQVWYYMLHYNETHFILTVHTCIYRKR